MKLVERVWRHVHTLLLMVGDGATVNLERDMIRSTPAHRPPPNAGEEVRELEQRWDKATTPKARKAVVMDAVELWRYLIPQADARLKRDTAEWRHAIALSPHPAEVVARIYGVSRRTVFNYRREFSDGVRAEV